ncbi:MAG: hypothetical protein KDA24_02560 [Deltaproteobacteria bacterium]|nr:hypothetical protein [Deltaproteobacteria bacterium]
MNSLRSPVLVDRVQAASELAAFVALAAQLQGDDPCFVPPLEDVQARRLRKAMASSRRFAMFLARRGRDVIGRIAVIEDKRHTDVHREKVVFFGFFETSDDSEVVGALLDAARTEARAWGGELLRGPRNLSRIAEIGVLVDGHDTPPPMLAGHAPPHYARLLEGAGLTPHHDILAWEVPLVLESGELRDVPERMRHQITRARTLDGLEVRPANWWRIVRDLRLAHTVFVEAFRDVPDNTPMPLSQWLKTGLVFLLLSSRHMLQIATVHGKPAGFALCFVDLNEATVAMRGRLLPFGWLGFLRAVPQIRTASFKLLGVLPEYRASGLHMLMAYQACVGTYAAGYVRLEASLVDSRNRKMCRMLKDCDAEVYRRYRVFEGRVADR